MSVRKIVALLGLTAALLTPALTAQAAEPLAPGTYEVTVGESLITLVVADDGTVDVGAPDGVSVVLELDENEQPLDEFSVVIGEDESHAVDIDVADDGSYTYALDSGADDTTTDEATDDTTTDATDEATDDATDEATDDATDADADAVEEDGDEDEAPGQHGRDNARAHGGNAFGYGAEGRDGDAEAEAAEDDEAADDEASAEESAEDEASEESEASEASDDSASDEASDDVTEDEVSDAGSEDARTNKHGKPIGNQGR